MKHRNMTFPFSFQKRAQSILLATGALLFVSFLILFLQGASLAQSNPPPSKVDVSVPDEKQEEPPAKSTVRGKVVYDDTGRPVRRARIYLFKTDGKSSGNLNSLTNNNGEFEIKNVPQGKYFVMVNSPGILTPFGFADDFDQIEKYPEQEFFDRAKEFFDEFSIDGTSDKKIEIKAKRGGAISGKVTYSNGDPAVGVRVNVLRKKDKTFSRVMTGLNASIFSGVATDDRGVYRVSGLPPGEYLVSVAEPSSHNDKNSFFGNDGFDPLGISSVGSFLVTYYPDANTPENATTVKINLGQEQDDINITIADRELHKIAGKVIARGDKNPIKGATVRLKKKDNKIKSIFGDRELNSVQTDEQGNWSFQELPDGVYTITVESFAESEAKYDENGEYKGTTYKRQLAGKKQDVTLSGNDESDVVLELSDGGTISGTVTLASGKPLQDSVYVKAKSIETDKSDEVPDNPYDRENRGGGVEKDGKFTIHSLPAGPVNLSVNWYGGNSDKYYVKSMTVSGLDLTSSVLNLTEGGKVKDVRIILGDDAATLKGKVNSPDGKPAYGVGVMLISTDPAKWKQRNSNPNQNFTATDSQGEFSITKAPGEYFIVFLRAGDNTQNPSSDWIRERTANAQRVSLMPNETKTITLNAPQ